MLSVKAWKRWAAAGAAGLVILAAAVYGPAVWDAAKEGRAMAAETQASASAQRTVSVSAAGKLSVEPDVAYASFGVMTKGATANEAQAANSSIFAAIEKVLKEQFRMADKDIKTSGFSVYPEYSYPERAEPKITGYTAQHTVTVTVRDLERLGDLLDAVSKAGANRVNGIQFGTEKADAYELQAIELAMKQARMKADTIAKAAGLSVTGVLHVQQGGSSGGAPAPYVGLAKEMAMMDAGAATSIQPGQLEFSTTVSVTYEMK